MIKNIILLILVGGVMFLGILFAKNSTRPDVLGFGEKKPPIPRDFDRLFEFVERYQEPQEQCNLGDVLYFHGAKYLGSYLSQKEAVSYWHDACNYYEHDISLSRSSQMSKACFRLGKYFLNKDLEKAKDYFRQSVKFGNSESKMIMAMLVIKQERTVKKGHYTTIEPRESRNE